MKDFIQHSKSAIEGAAIAAFITGILAAAAAVAFGFFRMFI